MNELTVDRIARDLEARHAPAERLRLDFGETVVGFRSNSRELNAALAGYYRDFVSPDGGPTDVEVVGYEAPELELDAQYTIKEPDPGKTKIKEEFFDPGDGRVVRKRLTGMIFLFGGGWNVAVGPCLANDNQVINFINNRLIQRELDRGALLAHAAAVNAGGRGLALAGFAGMGKSTLALHLMSRGGDFISNDRLLILDDGGRTVMRGVPKLPRINPGTALNNPDLKRVIPEDEQEQFAAMSTEEIWNLEHKYDVFIDECFGPGRFALNSPMDGLVVLNWHRDGSPPRIDRVDPDQRRDLLGAVMKSPGLFYVAEGRKSDQSEAAFIQRLARVPMYEISGGVDFDQAADLCLEKLGAGA